MRIGDCGFDDKSKIRNPNSKINLTPSLQYSISPGIFFQSSPFNKFKTGEGCPSPAVSYFRWV